MTRQSIKSLHGAVIARIEEKQNRFVIFDMKGKALLQIPINQTFDGDGNWFIETTGEQLAPQCATKIELLFGSAETSFKVRVTREGVSAFNARWPGSKLRDTRAYWFEFDATGDLIDTDVPQHDDGPEAKAMADDCKAFVIDDELPTWAE